MNKINVAIRAEPPFFDLGSLQRQPYERFAELRQRTPIAQYGKHQYIVVGGAEVMSLMAHQATRQISGLEFVAGVQIPDGITSRFAIDVMMFADAMAHQDRRCLFERSFSRPAMQAMRPVLRDVADRLVAELPRKEVFDLVDAMAARIPIEAVAAILGLPKRDLRRISPLVYETAHTFMPIYPNARHDQIERATQALCDYFFAQLKLRQAAPRDDVLSGLVSDWMAKPDISFDGLVFQLVGLLVAAAATTRFAFGMLVGLLLQRPLLWSAVGADRQLIPGAITESLRYEPPVASIPRITSRPLQVGDFTLPKGSFLRLSTMAALRDPALYAEPERFDIKRKDHPPLHCVFGLGPHRCLGAFLATIALEESLGALLDAAPKIEMMSLPRLAGFGGLRQMTPLHVYIP